MFYIELYTAMQMAAIGFKNLRWLKVGSYGRYLQAHCQTFVRGLAR
jgi:hypothetical protein